MCDLNLNCREASRIQSEAMDHPLPLGKRIGLRLHLWICRWCRRYGRQLKFLREAAQHQDKTVEAKSSSLLSAEAKERMRQILKKNE
jgi:hypothetical protein